MRSLKEFRRMAALPNTIKRWDDAAEFVKAGQQALTDQAAAVAPPAMLRGSTRALMACLQQSDGEE